MTIRKRGLFAVFSLSTLVVGILGGAGAGTTGLGEGVQLAEAAVSDWQQGASIPPAWNTDYSSGSFQQSVKNLASTGANYVTLIVPLYQLNVGSTDVRPGGNTPTDQALADGINFIHSQGMHVMLKFQLFPEDGQWSAYINPNDRATWFANYKNVISHYIQIAQATGVEEVCLGTELISMAADTENSTNSANWKSLIASVRGIYSGKLTYSANWGESGFPDEKNHINFWSALDYIGISAYFNLSGDGSVAALLSSWDGWNKGQIAPLQAKWGKPVLFTELGYKSIHDSYLHPWMWWEGGAADQNQQANDYQALFQYWNDYSYMQGVQLWYWTSDPNGGGAGNNDYTPQSKAAQTVMKNWFGAVSPTPTPTPGATSTPPSTASNPTFTSTASVLPSTPAPGQATNFAIRVTDTDGGAFGLNVDAEIYNAAGQQVFQKIFSGQNFTANGSQNYQMAWAAGASGSYVLKIGVFSGDWTQNHFWNNRALAFSVGADGSTGSSSSNSGGAINVWWPTNGASVSGIQPFKAMLTDAPVDAYNMFWQVDGGQLNPMASDYTDYPHKEASVDVSPWSWRGGGPYAVSFIAKSPAGQVLAQNTVNITVLH